MGESSSNNFSFPFTSVSHHHHCDQTPPLSSSFPQKLLENAKYQSGGKESRG